MLKKIFSRGLTLLIGIAIGMYWFSANPELCQPWFEIDPAVEQKIMKSIAIIGTGTSEGSGCEIKPDVYLTAFHVISDAYIDGDAISVNGKPAKLIYKSKLSQDFAVLTTDPTITEFTFEPYANAHSGQNIIIAGNPGTLKNLIQYGKIERIVFDKKGNVNPESMQIITQYIELGISGGCIYDTNGTPFAVVSKKNGNSGSSLGTGMFVNANQ